MMISRRPCKPSSPTNATRRFDVQLGLPLKGAASCSKRASPGPRLPRERYQFIRCTMCGKMLDMRDLGDVLDHLHGQEIEEELAAH